MSEKSSDRDGSKRIFCAFCGRPPSEKNREHVLPKWLIKMTGDFNRVVYFGYDYKNKKLRQFAYSALTVPACKACNEKFSVMEAKVRPIVENMLGDGAVNREQIFLLLDWFDKVRVGMWTLYYMLDNNMAGITPQYAIEQRMRLKDRMLIISKSSDLVKDLTYRGCNTPSFYYTPSAFSLMINNYTFTNISHSYLLSRELGLPYAVDKKIGPDGRLAYGLRRGLEQPMKPKIAQDYPIPATRIYQPIWVEGLPASNDYYETEYVASLSLSGVAGVGLPIIDYGETFAAFPEQATDKWIPTIGPETLRTRYLVSKAIIKIQDDIDELAPDYSEAPEEDRGQYDAILRSNKIANAKLLRDLDDQWIRHVLGGDSKS